MSERRTEPVRRRCACTIWRAIVDIEPPDRSIRFTPILAMAAGKAVRRTYVTSSWFVAVGNRYVIGSARA